MKKVAIIWVFIIATAILLGGSSASAADASGFDPGRIIDDEVFYNKDDMGGVGEIQAFLNAHVPSCDTWGTQPSGHRGLTNAQYAQQIKGWHGPPYVCLSNYHENPNTGETSYERGGGYFAGGQSAAQIIYNAAQKYNINPKVLLVTLRKESVNLFGDSWPLKSQYKYAMGYACPDSGPGHSANCDAARAGFYKQMDSAAWQLRHYYNNMGSYNYAPHRWNTIQYSTDPACGTKDVYIQNYATASLYIYTPYTPNDAALRAYPGTAPCGAYGNRNFWFMFREWFGTTLGRATATQLNISSSDNLGQRFVDDPIRISYTVTNNSKVNFTYKAIGIAGRDPSGNNIDPVWLNNFTLRAGESKVISATVTPKEEGQYQFFISSWLEGDVGWRACQLNNTENTCFNPYLIHNKPELQLRYSKPTIETRWGNSVGINYTLINRSKYPLKGGRLDTYAWVNEGVERVPIDLPDIPANSQIGGSFARQVPHGKRLMNFQIVRGNQDATTPNINVKPGVTLTQGLTLTPANPRVNQNVTGSFKIRNFSDRTYTTKDQLCYIIRDTKHNGNHDFGCLDIGTLQPGEEKTFSRVGHFNMVGDYKAHFAIYNGSYWRPFDSYLPETGRENIESAFNVKPGVTLTQGLTLTPANPRVNQNVTGSFKIRNFSDRTYTTKDQLCYIIRDTKHNGNHDFGCLDIGTLQPGEEKTFSRVGHFNMVGDYKAHFAIYNGSYWRPFDSYLPETGRENIESAFNVKPGI